MTEHDNNAPMQSVSDQAAEWFIRLRDRDLDAAERRRYVRWLKQSPSHISEFMRLVQMYGRVKRAKIPTLPPIQGEPSNVVALSSDPAGSRPAERSRFGPRTLRFATALCCLALVFVIGSVAKIALFGNRIETAMSEWRQFQLTDGTTVSAGPNTLLEVDYSDERRSIHLQRGEALFTVVKDWKRPFLVNADTAVARAVGTRFGVERKGDAVAVTVAEGEVAVARGEQATMLERPVAEIERSAVVSLVADQRVEMAGGGGAALPPVEKVDAARALAWARGLLIFQGAGAPLSEAVEEFNRRNRIQIEVDPAVADIHICCEFDVANPEAFAAEIAGLDSVVLVRERPDRLRLMPRSQQSARP